MSVIFVTGATGTIGHQTVKALRAAGATVHAAARSPKNIQTLETLGAKAVDFDFEAPERMAGALAGVDALFLLTPFVELPAPLVDAALRAAKAAGVKHVVRISAAGADVNAPFEIGRHHGEAEEVVKTSGLGWTILRPNFFQDNPIKYQGQSIRQAGQFYGASGEGRSSSISSTDIADVSARILLDPAPHDGKIYELTGPEAYSDPEAAEKLSEVLGRKVTYVDLPPEQHKAGLLAQHVPGWMAQAMSDLETIKRNGWAAAVSPDVERILGRPAQRFEDWLRANEDELTPLRG